MSDRSGVSKSGPSTATAMRSALPLIFVGLALMAMGQTVLFAVLGPVAREIGLTELQTGAVISAAALTIVLVVPAWGRASDRIGRKRVLVFALGGFATTSLGFALVLEAGRAGWLSGTAAVAALVLTRVVYALASGGGQPAAGGYIADTSPSETRSGAMALIGGAFGIGAILGPATAFLLGGLGVLAPVYAIAALGGAWAILVAIFMREPVRVQDGDRRSAALSAFDPRIRWILLGVVVVFAAISMVQQTIAFYVQDLGGLDAAGAARRTGLQIAVLALANLCAFAAVAWRKPAPGPLIVGGGVVAALGVGLLLHPASLAWIAAAHAVMGAGFGMFLPGAQTNASLAVEADRQGAAAGYVAAAMAGGFIVGPLLGTGLYMAEPAWTYVVAAGLAGIGALVGSRRGSMRA